MCKHTQQMNIVFFYFNEYFYEKLHACLIINGLHIVSFCSYDDDYHDMLLIIPCGWIKWNETWGFYNMSNERWKIMKILWERIRRKSKRGVFIENMKHRKCFNLVKSLWESFIGENNYKDEANDGKTFFSHICSMLNCLKSYKSYWIHTQTYI